MYDKRNSLSSLIEKEVREYFDMNVYKFNVPRNVTSSEAPSHGFRLLYTIHEATILHCTSQRISRKEHYRWQIMLGKGLSSPEIKRISYKC